MIYTQEVRASVADPAARLAHCVTALLWVSDHVLFREAPRPAHTSARAIGTALMNNAPPPHHRGSHGDGPRGPAEADAQID